MEIPYQIHVHHQKKLKDYIFDFFMLFVAVSLGFFVENKRESMNENKREKSFVNSLLNDLREDTVKLNASLSCNWYMISGLDSLARHLQNHVMGDTASTRVLYYYYINYARGTCPVKFTDRALAAIKNSGNLRIIHSQDVADSILYYDESVRLANLQDGVCTDNWVRAHELAVYIFDYKYIGFTQDVNTHLFNYETHSSYQLLSEEKALLKRYANLIESWKQVTFRYDSDIYTAKLKAVALLSFLKKEYDIE